MSDSAFHTRREFLHKGLALVSASATVPLFLDRTAWAIADPLDVPLLKNKPGANDDRVLVVVQLAGGNDGLNTVIPFEDDLYYKARPRLAVPKGQALRLDDHVAFHPEAEGLKALYDDGLLAVIQGVGYPNPNRSHFIATDIWATADPTERTHDGWIGRYFDCTCSGRDRPDPKRGIALTSESPLAMQGVRFNPVSFSRPEELTWRGPGARGAGLDAFKKLNATARGAGAADPDLLDESSALAYLERIAMDARASAEEIQNAAGASSAGRFGRRENRPFAQGRGNNQLSQQLTMVRRMIAAGLDTKVYYVSMGGFDTHAGQVGRHQNLLRQLGTALAEFTTGLKEDGLLDRVLLMTFSEFGRRVAENASQGTDHGAAAPLFVIGGNIRPGLHGRHPSLEPAKLDRGDLKWHTDFRSIYTSVLKDWLRADATKILGSKFKSLDLFKRA